MHGSSPAYMDYRTLRLPWRGRKVLRPDLNRSESRWDAAAPPVPPQTIAHRMPEDRRTAGFRPLYVRYRWVMNGWGRVPSHVRTGGVSFCLPTEAESMANRPFALI